MTLLILIFSEIIPKTIGATYWRQLATVRREVRRRSAAPHTTGVKPSQAT
jgi:CBS domain containing-hemolysin-like protein